MYKTEFVVLSIWLAESVRVVYRDQMKLGWICKLLHEYHTMITFANPFLISYVNVHCPRVGDWRLSPLTDVTDRGHYEITYSPSSNKYPRLVYAWWLSFGIRKRIAAVEDDFRI